MKVFSKWRLPAPAESSLSPGPGRRECGWRRGPRSSSGPGATAWPRALFPGRARLPEVGFHAAGGPGSRLSSASLRRGGGRGLRGAPAGWAPGADSLEVWVSVLHWETPLLSKQGRPRKGTKKRWVGLRGLLTAPASGALAFWPRARPPPPGPGGGVARSGRHLGRRSRRGVYLSMVARSRPAPP